MAINRFYRRSPYDLGLYTPPVDSIYAAMEGLQKRYDFNRALVENLKTTYINALPQDKARAAQIQQEWFTQIDKIVEGAKGDFGAVSKDLNALTSKMRKDLAPTSEAGTIINNYNSYQKWLSEHQERVKKGDVIGQDLGEASAYYMNKYKGATLDPNSGVYSGIELKDMSSYVPIDEMALKVIGALKPIKAKKGTSYLKNGNYYHDVVEVEGVSSDRIAGSLNTVLPGDQRVVSYLQDKLMYMGQDPSKAPEFLDAYSNNMGQTYAYESSSSDREMKRDPMSVAQYRARQQQKQTDQIESMIRLGYSNTVPQLNQQGKTTATLTPETLGTTLGIYAPTQVVRDENGELGDFGVLNFLGFGVPQQGEVPNLGIALADPKYKERLTNAGVDVAALDFHFENMDRAGLIDRNKYANDKAYQKKIDADIMETYNVSVPNLSARQTIDIEIASKDAQTAILRNEIPRLLGPAGEYYDVAQKRIIKGNDMDDDMRAAFYDEKGNLKDMSDYYVGVQGPQGGIGEAGYGQSGFKVTLPGKPQTTWQWATGQRGTPGKEIIIPIREPKLKGKMDAVVNSFGPIWNQSSTVGNPHPDLGTPRRVFGYDQGRIVDKQVLDLPDGRTAEYSTETMQEHLAPYFQTIFPTGATKSDQTQHLLPVMLTQFNQLMGIPSQAEEKDDMYAFN